LPLGLISKFNGGSHVIDQLFHAILAAKNPGSEMNF
jgi:hypothetical protein